MTSRPEFSLTWHSSDDAWAVIHVLMSAAVNPKSGGICDAGFKADADELLAQVLAYEDCVGQMPDDDRLDTPAGRLELL